MHEFAAKVAYIEDGIRVCEAQLTADFVFQVYLL